MDQYLKVYPVSHDFHIVTNLARDAAAEGKSEEELDIATKVDEIVTQKITNIESWARELAEKDKEEVKEKLENHFRAEFEKFQASEMIKKQLEKEHPEVKSTKTMKPKGK